MKDDNKKEKTGSFEQQDFDQKLITNLEEKKEYYDSKIRTSNNALHPPPPPPNGLRRSSGGIQNYHTPGATSVSNLSNNNRQCNSTEQDDVEEGASIQDGENNRSNYIVQATLVEKDVVVSSVPVAPDLTERESFASVVMATPIQCNNSDINTTTNNELVVFSKRKLMFVVFVVILVVLILMAALFTVLNQQESNNNVTMDKENPNDLSELFDVLTMKPTPFDDVPDSITRLPTIEILHETLSIAELVNETPVTTSSQTTLPLIWSPPTPVPSPSNTYQESTSFAPMAAESTVFNQRGEETLGVTVEIKTYNTVNVNDHGFNSEDIEHGDCEKKACNKYQYGKVEEKEIDSHQGDDNWLLRRRLIGR